MINPKKEAMIEHLIFQGAISVESMNPITGETTYTINEKLKDVSPELYYELEQQFNYHIFELSQKGPMAMEWKIRL
jgi:hypothetical protein